VNFLEDAIRKHRDQRGDDRCWEDDLSLYFALQVTSGEEAPKREELALADRVTFLENCARYCDRRHPDVVERSEPGAPQGRWFTAIEVAEYARLKERMAELASLPTGMSPGQADEIEGYLREGFDIAKRYAGPMGFRDDRWSAAARALEIAISTVTGKPLAGVYALNVDATAGKESKS
jgi:hypothetical protein